MGRYNLLSLTAVLLLITIQSNAQITLDAQIRPRFEVRNGYRDLPEKNDQPNYFTSQRSRLNLGYQHNKHLSARFSVQDVRIWGESGNLERGADINLFEAYLRFAPKRWLYAQIGRQQIEYDNCKIISISEWQQQARSFDAALFGLQSNDSSLKAEMSFAINNDSDAAFREHYSINNFRNIAMLWINKTFENSQISFLAVNRGMQAEDTSTNYSQTFGFYAVKNVGKLSMSGNYYQQTGQTVDGLNINAFLIAATADYKITDKWIVGAGTDILSGTPSEELNATDNQDYTTNTFEPLYARRHRYFGIQDLFYAGGFNVPQGLQDFYATLKYKASDKVSFRLDGHTFSTYETILNESNENLGRDLGTEWDFRATYRYSKDFKIAAAYTQFFATDAMYHIKGGDRDQVANFFYLEINFTPTLFKN